MKKTLLILGFSLFGCVSETTHEERFRESGTLSSALSAISLPNPNAFTFSMVGDTHVGSGDTSRLGRILSAASGAGDAFIVLLGDIVDKGEETDFVAVKNVVASAGYAGKVLYAIGNHDVFYGGWQHYKTYFGASHYVSIIGNSRFVVIDTADGMVGRDQYEWIRDQLKVAGPTNTFVLSHYLPFIPGERTYLKLADEDEALRLMKLVSNFDVRAWFGAHYHSFSLGAAENVMYVVAGGGGGRRMRPVEKFFYVQVIVNGSDVQYLMKEVS